MSEYERTICQGEITYNLDKYILEGFEIGEARGNALLNLLNNLTEWATLELAGLDLILIEFKTLQMKLIS